METLSTLIDSAVEGGFLSRYRFNFRRGQEVSVLHFPFSDYTLIFYKDTKEEMTYLSWTTWFEAGSDLRII